jgi:acyl phosphate:glycerol-3-phosphate acyltransferase
MDGVAIALSYIAGSIPVGLWLGLMLRGVDIREHGSKNIGATNTLRVLGKGLGAAALAGDAGKGIVSVLLISRLGSWEYLPLVCGLASIVGHFAPIFLRFKGGKGVATSAGVFLALAPLPMLASIALFAIVVGITRMVSVASLTAAIVMTVVVFVLPHDWATYPTHSLPPGWALRGAVAAILLVIIYRHRANIGRILRREESRF